MNRQGGPPLDPARGLGCLLGLAILAAPFLAVLYDVDAGLAVMAIALGAGAYLARLAMPAVEPGLRRQLGVAAVVNLALAVACAAALVLRLT